MANLYLALEAFGKDGFSIHMELLSNNGAWIVFLKKDDGTQYSGTSEISLDAAIEAVYRLVYP